MKLSRRLRTIANMVQKGETIADIGTDHGFLPIFLWEEGISPHVILSDVKKGPLEKAKENIEKHCPGKAFDIRRGNGLETLKKGEADVIVIAGMGGLLIADILGASPEIASAAKRIILQPRNAENRLRKWLNENGFPIVDEVLVREGKHICEILTVVPNHDFTFPEIQNELDYEVSPILFAKKDPLLVEFIENKIRIEKKVYAAIKAGATQGKAEKLIQVEQRLRILQKLRKRSG